jgi:hypothetical protein
MWRRKAACLETRDFDLLDVGRKEVTLADFLLGYYTTNADLAGI